MEREQFSKFRHEAVHELKDLNDLCEKEYRISSWPNWEYDLARGTLAFTQVVGTTSISSRRWRWGWANESLTPKVTTLIAKVRAFGDAENIPELTNAKLPDDECSVGR
jgi:hypothetical protein